MTRAVWCSTTARGKTARHRMGDMRRRHTSSANHRVRRLPMIVRQPRPVPGLPRPRPRRPRRRLLRANEMCEQPNSNSGVVMELNDLRVLVTGATAGIGRETAKLFARRGATVVVTGRNAERGEQTVAAIVAEGGHAEFLAADLNGP